MTLYHVTSKANQESIDRLGLLPEKATHKERAVWLVTRSNVMWALSHTANKPGRGVMQDMIVYEVDVPRANLRRFRRGIWRSFEVVRPKSFEPSKVYTDAYPN